MPGTSTADDKHNNGYSEEGMKARPCTFLSDDKIIPPDQRIRAKAGPSEFMQFYEDEDCSPLNGTSPVVGFDREDGNGQLIQNPFTTRAFAVNYTGPGSEKMGNWYYL